MTPTELLVGLGGLGVGYWVVSKVFTKKSPPTVAPAGAEGPRADPAPSATPMNPRWYQVLEVSPTASPDEIRSAYRRLMSQYHPDKVESLGIELKRLAERKTKEIGAAYRMGMQVNGLDG